MNEFQGDLPDILTPRLISAYLGICYSNALALAKSGEFSCIRIGNSYRVPRQAFEAWLNKPGLREILRDQ
ncbi:MAG: helix-turn-helix domain-containing protein [Thermaerobacter sp.]|nr:helix-turn-helix domain-containing protein [Thermaerobacter sp.]